MIKLIYDDEFLEEVTNKIFIETILDIEMRFLDEDRQKQVNIKTQG